uniref:Endonuclease/exonuclease/phosphatase domain-containing protein n=1 Tax=Poecilia mexicana TaxID=48701 RepID=A0A3B3XJ95_9TELE
MSTVITVVSLNVNALNNIKKRDKVLNKFRKEKVQVILLQETHLTKKGHGNSFSSSFGERHKRGVMTLISNSVKFELLEEIGDKEGRYLMIKGKLENQLITLLNVYAPPESDKVLFKKIFDLINVEAEGILIRSGDFNAVLNYRMDTTSNKNSKKQISRRNGLKFVKCSAQPPAPVCGGNLIGKI